MSIIEKNTVSAQAQTTKNSVNIVRNGGKYKVLFVGNSITRHAPKPEIGWLGDWGMAASAKGKDYVHVTVKLLQEKLGNVDYAIANCANWERQYYNGDALFSYEDGRSFCADIVVIRLGENIWAANERFDRYPIAPHFAKMIEYFTPNPHAKVVVTDLFWQKQIIDDAIREVVKQNGYTLVSLNDLGEDNQNMAIGQFSHAGVCLHPNDIGMRIIAERLVKAIL